MTFGKNNRNRRLAVGGTYGVGKSTTSMMLSEVTGLSWTFGKQMRQILAETFPDKLLENCNPSEIYQLVLTRFADRKAKEEQCRQGFVSDGSALHEWAYGTARIVHGANGPGSEITDSGFQFAMEGYGKVAKRHAMDFYDEVIHLPIEFPLPLDGHRPVSESFRNYAENLMLETWKELGKPVTVVRGTIEERIAQIVEKLGLEVSETRTTPKKEEGRVKFERLEDALGNPQKRYLSTCYRNVQQHIFDVNLDLADNRVTAKVDLEYLSNWSTKKGESCEPHFTSIDAYLVFGQLAQLLMYSTDGITREQSNNMWLRESELVPRRAIVSSKDIPVELKVNRNSYPVLKGNKWHIAEMEGHVGNRDMLMKKYSVAYEMPSQK